MTIVCAALLAVGAIAALQSILGTVLVARLGDEPPADGATLPSVSIVIAARNEAEHVRGALASVLAQDHTALEVVFVDDRSEDATGRIADAIADADPRVRVVHVERLPEGWLGKNHALHAGAAEASGEWLLFTDADVVFEPSALRAALTAATRGGLDMLACSPRISSPSLAVRVFVAGFAIFFGLRVQPWRIRDPRSRASAGIGAFNLVRAATYRAAGGHTRLKLRPDDDLMLGKAVKQAGGRCDLQFGDRLMSVAWYPSLGALVQGLMKNAFAGVGYSVIATVASVVGLLALGVAPFVLAAWMTGPVRIAAIVVSAMAVAGAVLATRAAGLPSRYGLGLPLSSILFSYILLRAMVVTLRQGGIYWRGTFYALADLRRNRL